MAKGKYSKVVTGLPALPAEAKRQLLLDAEKAKVELELKGKTNASALTAAWLKARDAVDEIEDKLKAAELRREAVEQMAREAYENENVDQQRLADSGRGAYLKREPYASVEDQDAVRDWALNNGFATRLQLPWSTLNAEVKERLLLIKEGAAITLPPGVKVYVKTSVVKLPATS